jgi:hypothetical protein
LDSGTPPHVEVVMRYTDPVIREAYGRYCGELAARGGGEWVLPLVRMWDQSGFKEWLVLVVQKAEAGMDDSQEMEGVERDEDVELEEAAKTLLKLKLGGDAQACC